MYPLIAAAIALAAKALTSGSIFCAEILEDKVHIIDGLLEFVRHHRFLQPSLEPSLPLGEQHTDHCHDCQGSSLPSSASGGGLELEERSLCREA